MVTLGAHMSIAGGFHKAVEAARQVGCDCVQLFCKNNNQWRAKPITAEQTEQFRHALAEQQISHPLIHCSYLINLASPDDTLWEKSIDALVVEIQRADQLGIPYRSPPSGGLCDEFGIRRVTANLAGTARGLSAKRRDFDTAVFWRRRPAKGRI